MSSNVPRTSRKAFGDLQNKILPENTTKEATDDEKQKPHGRPMVVQVINSQIVRKRSESPTLSSPVMIIPTLVQQPPSVVYKRGILQSTPVISDGDDFHDARSFFRQLDYTRQSSNSIISYDESALPIRPAPAVKKTLKRRKRFATDRCNIEAGDICESEYFVDIIAYLRYYVDEQHVVRRYHLRAFNRHLTADIRAGIIDWIMALEDTLKISPETFAMFVRLLDAYLEKVYTPTHTLLLVALGCVWILLKAHEVVVPTGKKLVAYSGQQYTIAELQKIEINILSEMGFKVNVSTPYGFVCATLKDLPSDDDRMSCIWFIINTFEFHMHYSVFRSIEIASAAIHLSQKYFKWRMDELQVYAARHSYLSVDKVSDVVFMMDLQMRSLYEAQSKSYESNLKEKFASEEFGCISTKLRAVFLNQ